MSTAEISAAAQLAPAADAEVASLRIQIAAAEKQLAEVLAEKGEAESLLYQFNVAMHTELGELLKQVLQARRHAAEAADKKQHEKIRQAQQDYEQFKQRREESAAAEPIQELSDADKAELTKLYKKSIGKVHPDKFPADQQAAATQITQELNTARQAQDLPRMRELAAQISQDDWDAADRITDAQALRARLDAIWRSIHTTRDELQVIYADRTWQTLQHLVAQEITWPDYFADLRAKLEKELVELKSAA